MAKRARRTKEESRDLLTAAAAELLKTVPADRITVDAVAEHAGCAKGLITYHFGNKQALIDAALDRMSAERISSWTDCLDRAATIPDAMDATWDLLTAESVNGSPGGWSSLLFSTDQRDSSGVAAFATALGIAYNSLAERGGLDARLLPGEVGWWLASTIVGLGAALGSGADPGEIRSAYMASWLGMLAIAEQSAG
jgi:AcrR family transcriptional regulator